MGLRPSLGGRRMQATRGALGGARLLLQGARPALGRAMRSSKRASKGSMRAAETFFTAAGRGARPSRASRASKSRARASRRARRRWCARPGWRRRASPRPTVGDAMGLAAQGRELLGKADLAALGRLSVSVASAIPRLEGLHVGAGLRDDGLGLGALALDTLQLAAAGGELLGGGIGGRPGRLGTALQAASDWESSRLAAWAWRRASSAMRWASSAVSPRPRRRPAGRAAIPGGDGAPGRRPPRR